MAHRLAEQPAMAKKKSAEVMVRIESDVAKLAKMVASFEDRSISEVISEVLRAPLSQRYEAHLNRAQQEIAKQAPASKPPKR